MFIYLALDFIFITIWSFLFFYRKDLRKKIFLSSIVLIPLGFFDYLSQPNYWHPPTFFSLPVGIEGIVFGFSIGGIASVLYEEITNKHLKKFRKKKPLNNNKNCQ